MRFVDIGANLTDAMYAGEYHGTRRHEADLPAVVARARAAGVERMVVTGGSLEESRRAVEVAGRFEGMVATVGCHPTRCGEFEAEGVEARDYLASLLRLVQDNRARVAAIGEVGLDYDRTQFCPPEVQRRYLELQLELAAATSLPLFLHCRAAAADLVTILSRNMDKMPLGGVVHSFDGSAEERDALLALGLHIGINGCSLKTEANLAVAAGVPADRLLLETDCPWCDIRPAHAGYKLVASRFPQWPAVDKKKWREGAVVKGRNEPHTIRQVLEVVAAVREEDPEQLAETVFLNSERLFFS